MGGPLRQSVCRPRGDDGRGTEGKAPELHRDAHSGCEGDSWPDAVQIRFLPPRPSCRREARPRTSSAARTSGSTAVTITRYTASETALAGCPAKKDRVTDRRDGLIMIQDASNAAIRRHRDKKIRGSSKVRTASMFFRSISRSAGSRTRRCPSADPLVERYPASTSSSSGTRDSTGAGAWAGSGAAPARRQSARYAWAGVSVLARRASSGDVGTRDSRTCIEG